MKKLFITLRLLLLLLMATDATAQSINASVGGTVADPTGALIPGVTVTATNTGTGIAASVVSNESGAYSFPSLQPGTYKLSAELPGFQIQTLTNVQLGGSQQVRLNFTLQVAAAAGTNVEVTVAADTLLATSSNSVGTMLPEYKLRDLPVATRNVFNLVATTPGVQSSNGTIGIMAGGRLGDVNATRDGINVNDGRYENGAWSVVFTSPDMVEEVKVVVAPVDAETARGSGQVSMVTRSGTNKFRGTAVWANHNSALDSNSWFNNFNGVDKSYDNRNQYTVRFSGPLVKNKTFFLALFDGQRDLKKTQATGTTLTDMAKAGIFRYFPGADNANANNNDPTVDRAGNPVTPSRATGPLSAIDLFGNCTFKGAAVPNCKSYRDPLGNRLAISQTSWIQETLKRMPSPNEFTGGDGLNTATIRFVRRQEGLDLTNGNGDEVDRDQYNARIDHTFNSRHKMSLIATKEHTWGTATQAGLRAWPQGYDGLAVKRPYVYTIQFTSTLSSSLVNQVRLGKKASNNWQWGSADRGDAIGAEARKLHPVANGIAYQVTFASIAGTNISNIGGFGRWREGINPLRSAADDLSWTVRRHSFKMGYEWRRNESNGFNDPNYDPVATMGSPAAFADSFINSTNYSGITSNAQSMARNILYDLTGSIRDVNEAFGVVSSKDTRIVGTPTIRNNRHWNYQSEGSAYFKDEWKFRSNLTLNLGVHWEYYGQPYEHDGLAARVVGGLDAFTNLKCTSSPNNFNFTSSCTDLVQVQFVGKNSPHPEILTNVLGNDLNNFAPSVGFSYNPGWGGRDKTVIRAGYGVNYEGALRNFITVDGVTGTVPGINLVSGGSGRTWTPTSYTSLSNLSLPIPLAAGTPTTSPFPVPVNERSLGITTYAHVSPYTQNWNFEIQSEVARNTTVEARYIGSKGTKRWGTYNLNAIAGLGRNRNLFDEFVTVRNGGQSAMLNAMLVGVRIGGTLVNTTNNTASNVLRSASTTRGNLANGNIGTLINTLNTNLAGGDNGTALRRAGYAENFITVSPQYSSVNIDGNLTNSTYHSLQLQLTRRLSSGFTNTSTMTWSKSMGPGGVIDPDRRNLDKALQSTDHKFQWTSNGTYELPFGRGRHFAGDVPGVVDQIIGGWQLSGIFNYNTGAPIDISSGIATIGTGGAKPNVVGEIPKDIGKVVKVANGVNYFDGYTQIVDPSFSPAYDGYTNKAILDPSGKLILVNPQPGQTGTLGYGTVRGPGEIRFDAAMVKRFRITEAQSFEFRIDAINVLNTPNFGNPSTSINGNNNFGRITSASGARSFITNLRYNF